MDKVVLGLAIISALMLPGCASAPRITVEVPELAASDTFAGYELVPAEGDPTGTATGSILNAEKGSIEYVVFSLKYPSFFGKPAMIGLSGELMPIPWTLLVCDTRTQTCSVDVTQRTLDMAPRLAWPARRFDRDLQQMMTAYWSQVESSEP
jgi:hypothetical protein